MGSGKHTFYAANPEQCNCVNSCLHSKPGSGLARTEGWSIVRTVGISGGNGGWWGSSAYLLPTENSLLSLGQSNPGGGDGATEAGCLHCHPPGLPVPHGLFLWER